MPLFACSGYRGYPDVEAGNAREAARLFADLRAKSEYGGGGECTCLTPAPGSILTFLAYVGNFRGPGVTAYRSVSITVEQQEN
jgi:hypothetical protein